MDVLVFDVVRLAYVENPKRHEINRALEQDDNAMDDWDNFIWSACLYNVSVDAAQGGPCYLPELRQYEKARYGDLPSLRRQMGNTGAYTA